MAKWDKDDTIIALDVYHNRATPQKISTTAKIIGKSPNSLRMKMGNFMHLDPNSSNKGLEHPSQLDINVWNEYCNNWNKLAIDAQKATERKLKIDAKNDSIIDRISKFFTL